MVQEAYPEFIPFLEDVMEELGFSTTDIQKDIAGYMAYGPQYLMVQAQRGQAKTTIAAAFAVWSLIHSPAFRILIVTAAGGLAIQISTLIVRIIMTMEILECMRPDKLAGDRASVEAFDLHHSLKGLDKSPSVACMGIDSNLPGNRADLLIADDIESLKNAATQPQRAKLLQMTKEFTSINASGRIVWLGTPQSRDSIYNSLPSRGVQIRIWPGRYPTEKQLPTYGGYLAPLITNRILRNPGLQSGGGMLGNQGQPVDPVLAGEEILQKKEQDKGELDFQLQHMLNTSLSDAMRYPIKLPSVMTLRTDKKHGPLTVTRGMLDSHMLDRKSADFPFKIATPMHISSELRKFDSIWAYIDPAPGGANADETAYAIGGFLVGNIYLLSVGGIPGGYDQEKMAFLSKKLAEFQVDGVTIEKNMGFGAFREVWTPVLRKHWQCQIDDDLVSGQKELRIINTLTPIIGRGSLIIDEEAIEEDDRQCSVYPQAMRQSYSLFYQASKLTATRNALIHDDRLDALEGLCRHFTAAIAQDQEAALEAARRRQVEEMLKDPFGHLRNRRDAPTAHPFTSMIRRSFGRR